MELALATAIGLLAACGIYLLLRSRSFDVILGLTFLSYATNLLIFAGAACAKARHRCCARVWRRPDPAHRSPAPGAGADRDRHRLRDDRDQPGAGDAQPGRQRQRPCRRPRGRGTGTAG